MNNKSSCLEQGMVVWKVLHLSTKFDTTIGQPGYGWTNAGPFLIDIWNCSPFIFSPVRFIWILIKTSSICFAFIQLMYQLWIKHGRRYDLGSGALDGIWNPRFGIVTPEINSRKLLNFAFKHRTWLEEMAKVSEVVYRRLLYTKV